MKTRLPVIFESVVLRGIQGIIEDAAIWEVAAGNKWESSMEDYTEARNIAQQILAQWRGWGLK